MIIDLAVLEVAGIACHLVELPPGVALAEVVAGTGAAVTAENRARIAD